MKLNRKHLIIVVVAALLAVLLYANGCKKSGEESGAGTAKAADSVALCVKCGQIKGSDPCCKPTRDICSKCNLVKGAPGCCTTE